MPVVYPLFFYYYYGQFFYKKITYTAKFFSMFYFYIDIFKFFKEHPEFSSSFFWGGHSLYGINIIHINDKLYAMQ